MNIKLQEQYEQSQNLRNIVPQRGKFNGKSTLWSLSDVVLSVPVIVWYEFSQLSPITPRGDRQDTKARAQNSRTSVS